MIHVNSYEFVRKGIVYEQIRKEGILGTDRIGNVLWNAAVRNQ